MRAEIIWKTKNMGGRNKPPEANPVHPYIGVVHFISAPWPAEIAWSLIVEKCESESSEYRWIAEVKYLVENAPHELLKPSAKFELYEGSKCVATGEVMGNA